MLKLGNLGNMLLFDLKSHITYWILTRQRHLIEAESRERIKSRWPFTHQQQKHFHLETLEKGKLKLSNLLVISLSKTSKLQKLWHSSAGNNTENKLWKIYGKPFVPLSWILVTLAQFTLSRLLTVEEIPDLVLQQENTACAWWTLKTHCLALKVH